MERTAQGREFELIPSPNSKMVTRHPIEGSFGT